MTSSNDLTPDLTPKDLAFAYESWRRAFSLHEADNIVTPFLSPSTNTPSWLHLARTGLLLSTREIAQRMQVSRQAVAALEKSESLRTISLFHLAQVAEAIDCELVYAIRPKSRKPFSAVVWDRIFAEVLPRLERRHHLPHMKGHLLASLAIEATRNPKVLKRLRLARGHGR